MVTMADLDELALSLPQTTKELSQDGRPEYRVHGKLYVCQRGRRKDAVDPETAERLDDVLMFRVADLGVKELIALGRARPLLHHAALRRLSSGAAAHSEP